jgi:hypothetical protein
MSERLPLPTLLSFALVAFTIEFDNEADHRLPHRTTRSGGARHRPWLVSLAMWSNCMRLIDEKGISARDLALRAHARTNLTGMRRWGYITIDENEIVRATSVGRQACEIWRPLFGAIEDRWEQRFGSEPVAQLRDSLRSLIERFDIDLPEALPILGFGLRNGLSHTVRPKGIDAEPSTDEDLPLSALLSKPLLALAFHYERDAAVSLAIGANVLRLVGDDGVLVRDLPRASGVSKEAIAMATNFLCKHGYAVMQTENRARRLTLTANGGRARDAYSDRLARVEQAWRKRFGERAIDRLQDALEEIAGPPAAPQSRFFEGLKSYPDGWRASVSPPQTLPHFPMVLHRGGYPDGS